jgi:hypothetical protein
MLWLVACAVDLMPAQSLAAMLHSIPTAFTASLAFLCRRCADEVPIQHSLPWL